MKKKKVVNKKRGKIRGMILFNSLIFIIILSIIVLIFLTTIVLAAANSTNETRPQISVCCEKTKKGAYCQNTQPEECDANYRQTPSSCDATSFCKLGCCYDSQEGICMESTPQRVCQEGNGTWADSKNCGIAQCNLGCCVLGEQAAFVPLVRCKRLAALYGLETDFRRAVKTEVDCVAIAQAEDIGACVYEYQFEKTCKFTTRGECFGISKKAGQESKTERNKTLIKSPNGTITAMATDETSYGSSEIQNITSKNVKFYKDYLCTAEELGTNCGPTTETMCIEGKDEIYFRDSCGNPANIYDSSKIYAKDKEYWRKVVKKASSCNANSAAGNADSASCGNCDYFKGSFCMAYKRGQDKKPTYGDFVCRDLNCKQTSDGKSHKHGESWCFYDDATGKSEDPVGSRHYRHLCYLGEELVEPCSDYRQGQCIQDNINGFSQAACRVNRWQDCIQQKNKIDCENTDLRDCYWGDEIKLDLKTGKEKEQTTASPTPAANTASSATSGTTGVTGAAILGLGEKDNNKDKDEKKKGGVCIPNIPPGLKFWEQGEARGICALANKKCIVEYEKGIIGGEKCKKNCDCLEKSWGEEMNKMCTTLGDCGSKINFAGKEGLKKGYETKIKKAKSDEKTGKAVSEMILGMVHLDLKNKNNIQQKAQITD